MKYLKNMQDLRNWYELPTYEFNLIIVFIVFVLVYRIGLNKWLYLNHPRLKKFKPIYCSSCFGFWLSLILSTNVLTAATAFLLYSFYEKNNVN
jgi:hypothetical protein